MFLFGGVGLEAAKSLCCHAPVNEKALRVAIRYRECLGLIQADNFEDHHSRSQIERC